MINSRRRFLKAGTLTLGGALFTGAASVKASAGTNLRPKLTSSDREVIAFLENFSSRILLVGGCVAAKINGNHRSTHLIANVANLDHLTDCLQNESAAHLGNCQAVGNTITFKKGNSEFTVENLLPEEFSERLRDMLLSTSGDINCPHEALQFDPQSGALSDPFSVLTETSVSRLVQEPYTRIIRKVRRKRNGRRRVRRIRRRAYRLVAKRFPAVDAELRLFPSDRSPEEGFTALTDALVDKITFGLNPDESFARDKSRILDPGTSVDSETAERICREFLRVLSSLAKDRGAIRELINSSLLKDCLAEVFGISADEILANFDRLRSASSSSYTDGSIWTALLLFDEIQRERAFPWIDQIDNLRRLRSQADLAQAALAFLK